ncbi:MAG: thiamine-phosphate kinase [Anaplasma sp.]
MDQDVGAGVRACNWLGVAVEEFACVDKYIRPLVRSGFDTEDDDAAEISSPSGSFVVTKDILVEGVHFLGSGDAGLLAKKALRVSLSDIAAMGARPYAYLLGLSLPKGTKEEWWQGFSDGLRQDNEHFAVSLVGGDTTSNVSNVVIVSITAMGIPADRSMTRFGARVGDILYVSGSIGDSALGLMAYQGLISGESRGLKHRYDLPEPRVSLGMQICGIASACIDISDGLIQDVGHICRLSGMGADLHLDKIPLSDEAQRVIIGQPELMEQILTGGDDYELAFTVPQRNLGKLREIANSTDAPITAIGGITEGSGVKVYARDGNAVHLSNDGYTHQF